MSRLVYALLPLLALSACSSDPAAPPRAEPEPTKPEPAKPEPAKPEPAKPEPAKPEPGKPKLESARTAYEKALARNREARKLITNRGRLFPDADRIGFADDALEPVYSFISGGTFRTDWKLVRGRSHPVPPGQGERYGLALEGRSGRAEFAAPIRGNFQLRIRVVSHVLGRAGGLTLAVEGEGKRRIAAPLGQLTEALEGRIKHRNGERAVLRAGATSTLVLVRSGKTLAAKVNGKRTAQLELGEDLGRCRLALEWDRVSVNLVSIGVLCHPDKTWVQSRLEGK